MNRYKTARTFTQENTMFSYKLEGTVDMLGIDESKIYHARWKKRRDSACTFTNAGKIKTNMASPEGWYANAWSIPHLYRLARHGLYEKKKTLRKQFKGRQRNNEEGQEGWSQGWCWQGRCTRWYTSLMRKDNLRLKQDIARLWTTLHVSNYSLPKEERFCVSFCSTYVW